MIAWSLLRIREVPLCAGATLLWPRADESPIRLMSGLSSLVAVTRRLRRRLGLRAAAYLRLRT